MGSNQVLFLKEAVVESRVSDKTLRRAIKRGDLKATLKANKWRIKREDLQTWLETSEERSQPVAPKAKEPSVSAPTAPGSTVYLWETILSKKDKGTR
jgi:excisionase family DNA binding protein